MKVMAQMAMVMNLDKCIGCHTCSVTCKQAWTNRAGIEYVWFNNVETRPGQGYPRTLRGPGASGRAAGCATRKGRLRLRGGGRLQELRRSSPTRSCPSHRRLLRALDLRLRDAHQRAARGAHPGGPAEVADHRQAHEDRVVGQLGRRPRRLARDTLAGDPILKKAQRAEVKLEFEQTFMFYLPRICEHCLNPSCVASCPSGAIYKRAEDGIVLVDQDRCRGWRMCVSGCPYKKVYFNHKTGKAEKCTLLLPAASRSACRRCARRPASGGCATSAWSSTTPTGCSRRPSVDERPRTSTRRSVDPARPARPRGASPRPAPRASPTTGSRPRSARRSTR